MRLKIPYRIQEPGQCGETCLAMVLEYFGKNPDMQMIRNIARPSSVPILGTWPIGIAMAAAKYGLGAEFYSRGNDGNEEGVVIDKEFAEKMRKSGIDVESFKKELESVAERAENMGVKMNPQVLGIEEIIREMSPERVPLLPVNNLFSTGKNYCNHMIVVSGYEDGNVLIHDPRAHAGPYIRVARDNFDKFRDAESMEVIFVSKS